MSFIAFFSSNLNEKWRSMSDVVDFATALYSIAETCDFFFSLQTTTLRKSRNNNIVLEKINKAKEEKKRKEKEKKIFTELRPIHLYWYICNVFFLLLSLHLTAFRSTKIMCSMQKQHLSKTARENWMNCVNKSCSKLRSLSYFSLTHASIIEMQMFMILPVFYLFCFDFFFHSLSRNQHSVNISIYILFGTSTFRINCCYFQQHYAIVFTFC